MSDTIVTDTNVFGFTFCMQALKSGPHAFPRLRTFVWAMDEEKIDVAVKVDALHAFNHVVATWVYRFS